VIQPPMICVIQARYGSKRLPGKVLMPIKGVPLIRIAYEKAVEAFGADNVVVAYPATVENLPLSIFLASHWMHSFASTLPEDDVLGRIVECARFHSPNPDTVVFRYTPDDHRKEVAAMKRVAQGERGIPVEIGGEAFTLAELEHANKTVTSEFKR
jgi:glutamate-1-semialdehyde 2,1-aminomutase